MRWRRCRGAAACCGIRNSPRPSSLTTQQMMAKPATQAAFQPVGDLLLTFPEGGDGRKLSPRIEPQDGDRGDASLRPTA